MPRFAAGTVHYLGSLSVAPWRAVLSVEDFSDGDDVVRVDPYHHGVHGGAVRGNLSPAARPRHVDAAAGRAHNRRRLAGGLRHRPALPASHQNVLLHVRSRATGTSA